MSQKNDPEPARPTTTPHQHPTHDTQAEQLRESQESQKAKEAEASIRERMVNIGRGNQQAGRQKS